MAHRERTEIRTEQRETLKSFFKEGMTRVGSPLIPRAASATGLETCVIENWIGNYRRSFKAPSEPRPSKPKLHTRELSPYNLFCRDLLRNKGTLNDIKGRWSTLGEDEKQKYYREAAALRSQGLAEDLSPEMRELKIKKHLKQLKFEVSKLEALGVETAILSFDRHKSSLEVYQLSSKGAKDTVNNFALYFKASFSAPTAPQPQRQHQRSSRKTKDQVDVLVKKVQDVFNQKYKEAGGIGRLPYQSLMNQSLNIKVAGLPNGLTLKKPSFYGRNQLEAILKDAKHISFKIYATRCHCTDTAEELSEDMDAEDTADGIQTKSLEKILKAMCRNDPLKKIKAKSKRREKGVQSPRSSFEEMEVTIEDDDECNSVKNRLSDLESDMENATETTELSAPGADNNCDGDVYVPVIPQSYKTSELKLECEEEELEPWQKHTLHVRLKEEHDVGELSDDQTDCKPDPSSLQSWAAGQYTVTPEACGAVHTSEGHQISNNPVSLASVQSPEVYAASSDKLQSDQSNSQTLSVPFPPPSFTVIKLEPNGT
ncbi:hypothetical protein ABVT39_001945 [Epinephelus coioides]